MLLRELGRPVVVASRVVCIVYYLVFLVWMIVDVDGSLAECAGTGLVLLWMSPFVIAGGWYFVVPGILAPGGC
ncbi:hypothetical protein [Mycobacteroides sp. LB1]|uniref:hypothetical protein n=1 Tax=Mycobacteroides sp. LB1 TaxID=2750814 RepID=UPI0015DD8ED3|nr:hypothetical protein [Mycobacteroides sp. LB1]